MFKLLKNKKAQAATSEYVLGFFLVVAVVTAMTMYFKRAVQANIRGARTAMLRTVVNRTGSYFTGEIMGGYEPYYVNTDSIVSRDADDRTELLEGATTGIFRKTIDESTIIQTQSETAAPKDAN